MTQRRPIRNPVHWAADPKRRHGRAHEELLRLLGGDYKKIIRDGAGEQYWHVTAKAADDFADHSGVPGRYEYAESRPDEAHHARHHFVAPHATDRRAPRACFSVLVTSATSPRPARRPLTGASGAADLTGFEPATFTLTG